MIVGIPWANFGCQSQRNNRSSRGSKGHILIGSQKDSLVFKPIGVQKISELRPFAKIIEQFIKKKQFVKSNYSTNYSITI